MNLKPITAKLTASSQILPSDLAAIETEGFTTVIDNRNRHPATGKRP